MKLIIDIPEIFYQNEKENKGYVSDLKRNIVWDAMIKGIPLDDISNIINQPDKNDLLKYIEIKEVIERR